MKIIVGLGNPGEKYKNSRHNVGFMVMDNMVQDKILSSVDEKLLFAKNEKFLAETVLTQVKGERIIFVKPTTFMNLSGEAVSKIMQYYKADISDIIVVYDDKDIPLGQIRVRTEGSSAGHNGLNNIIETLGTNQFTRIRVGISNNDETASPINTKDFVLAKFTDRETQIISETIEKVSRLILEYVCNNAKIIATTIEVSDL